MSQAQAIRFDRFGGPDVLEIVDVDIPSPGPHQVSLAHAAIGLNMVDTYYRSGLYALELPSGLGAEAAGTVVAVGAGVKGLKPGDRVAYASPPPLDAYASRRIIDAKWLVRLPEAIDLETAAAVMLKGLTSWYLLRRSYAVKPGDWIVLHAAAGGVGLIATQWAKALGAHVIGVVGSEAKRAPARSAGCDEVVVGTADLVERVRALTDGAGVPVVYDSVGRETFLTSLDCLRKHGVMVSFGNASGPVAPFSPLELLKRGSLYVTRPTLFDFIGERATLEEGAGELFAHIGAGTIEISINQRYALHDAAKAHRDLEGRRTTGSSILLP